VALGLEICFNIDMTDIVEYLNACRYRQSFLTQQLQLLSDERHRFQEDAERLQGVEQRIRQELIGYLLPEVQDRYLEELEQRLSYSGFLAIKREYDEKFEAAERRRVEIEGMDEYLHYEFLIDQANRKIEEVRPTYESKKAQIGAWESSKWFQRLKRRHYFELDYSAGLWRRFWDWRAVSLLMGHLRKKAQLSFENPTRLKEFYRHLRAETDDVVSVYESRVAERDRIEGIKTEHQELLKAPERLLGELFQALGEAALAHLDACPEDMRVELARNDKVLNGFFRKLTGVRKQVQYLRELPVTRVDSLIQQVKQEIAKLDAKIKKLEMQRRRGKRKRYSHSEIQRMREVKADKWNRRLDKTSRLRGRIAGFDRYDHGSFVRDYLWWDLITNHAMADDIYEVREFREQHPDWDRTRFEDPTMQSYGMGAAMVYDDVADDLASSMSDAAGADVFSDPS
jgi:hypothetical protein